MQLCTVIHRCLHSLWGQIAAVSSPMLILAGAVSGCSGNSTPAMPNTGLAVLCYHTVEADTDSVLNLSADSFHQQIQYLSQNDHHAVSLEDITAWMQGSKPLPPRAVLISFDDGHQSVYHTAYPILKKYGFVGALFLPAGWLNAKDRLSIKQVREMIRNGFSVGSHGFSHSVVVGLDKIPEEKEIKGSKTDLQAKLGVAIEFFVYPFGYFERQTAATVEANGYSGAFTVIPGKNYQNTDRFELKRLLITRNFDLETFKKLVNGDRRQLTELWQKEIPEYMYRGLFRPAEIEARELLRVDGKNTVARSALRIIQK